MTRRFLFPVVEIERRQCSQRIGMELAAIDHINNQCCGENEGEGSYKPAEVGKCEKESTLSGGKMRGGDCVHFGCPSHCLLPFLCIRIIGCGCRTNENGGIIEQPVRPGEFEKRVAENDGKTDDF